MTQRECPLANACRQAPEAVYVRAGEDELTFSEMDRRADRLAHWLSVNGVGPGDRVAIEGATSIALLTFFWACLRSGATVVPYSPRWTEQETQDALSRVAANRRFTHSEMQEIATEANDMRWEPTTDWERRPSATISTLIFSSGSTGVPKAIAHTLSAHIASASGSNTNLPLERGDRWLLSLPLFHVAGLGITFRCTIAQSTIVLPDPTLPLNASIESQRPTHLSLVPTQLLRLISETPTPPEQLKAVLLGGSPLPRELSERALASRWPLYSTYGLSEMASQVTTSRCAEQATATTAGTVLPGRKLSISSSGEILVRGDTLFAGYVDGAGGPVPKLSEDGWFETGDLGRLDDHERLVVLGRRDNMFVSGGENIHPEEIERHLLELPGVQQSIVVAVEDATFGHRPVAFVDGDGLAAEQMRQQLRTRIAAFKVPDEFLPWPAQSGLKPNRASMAALAREHRGSSQE